MLAARSVIHARCWICLVFLCASSSSLAGAEPSIRNLNLRGLTIGGTTNIILDGDDLGAAPRLSFSFAAKQELKTGATEKRAVFDVTLAGDVVPGYYNLRVVTDGGISLPVVMAVDRLPQQAMTPTTETVPVALHSAVSGANVIETKFTGKTGQKLRIEVEAQRLGSKLRPIVHLYSPKRVQLGWSWPSPSLFGDTRLETTLPEDGTYTVAVHDTEYAGPAPGFFRLRIGQWSFVDQVFPPVVAQTQPGEIELLGGANLPRTTLPSSPTIIPIAWPKQDETWSGPRPFVRISNSAEFVEQPAASNLQDLPVGLIGVSGRLVTPGEEDRYRLAVVPGSKLRFEAFSERLGTPLDVAIVIRGDKNEVLARGEDGPGTVDPILDYVAPANVSSLIVGVVDAQGRGNPRGVYRLVIDPLTPEQRSDFQLSTVAQRILLPVGGRTLMPVLIDRQGYTGSVELLADQLPAGVKLAGANIPDGADGALVTVTRDEASFDPVISTWRGQSAKGQSRQVLSKGHPLERQQPWLATELALAPTTFKAADFQVDWRDLPSDAQLVLAGKLPLPIKVTRLDDKALVRLSLITSQIVTLLNNQPDPNKTLRAEKPVELAAKATDGEVILLVPADLSSPVYDVTVQAELLTADKKTVLATAFAPVKRLKVISPVALELAGELPKEITLDAKTGATVKVTGKVLRRAGLAGDVTITLAGIPAGARANPVIVKADASDFTVELVLPVNQPAGELKGLKLSATAVPDPKLVNVRVKSPEVDVVLVVQQPPKT
jgi:hypothetical protein